MSHSHAVAKQRRTSRQPSHLALLGSQMARLRRVEGRMDALFRQVLEDLSEEEILHAVEQFDALVSTFCELRLANLGQYPDEAWLLVSKLDLEQGPLPGFQEVMERLCELCLTSQAICGLRSRLYTVAARVAEERPELLPTVAIAALSLDTPDWMQNVFVEMVICASAIEWFLMSSVSVDLPASPDVSTWLAAEPSDLLLTAVGKERAYYYASIPGVLPFLDQSCVLFDVRRLVCHTRAFSELRDGHDGHILGYLVDRRYKARLRAEIERVQNMLRQRYPAKSIADAEMLTKRALEALDDLPPQVNPLLQAIWVQSWVRHFDESC